MESKTKKYQIMNDSSRVNNKGIKQKKANGKFLFEPHHSYLIKTSIAKERNKRAAKIVRIVCTMIEESGDPNTYDIERY